MIVPLSCSFSGVLILLRHNSGRDRPACLELRKALAIPLYSRQLYPEKALLSDNGVGVVLLMKYVVCF